MADSALVAGRSGQAERVGPRHRRGNLERVGDAAAAGAATGEAKLDEHVQRPVRARRGERFAEQPDAGQAVDVSEAFPVGVGRQFGG